MSPTPKTIQIYLPGGDPRGIRIAEITTRIVQVIEVPRSLLPEFIKMPESNQVALYFLFGEADDGLDSKVYIGQTGDLRSRLGKHNKDKDFWQRAFVLISRTNSLTQTHGLFLEWFCLQAASRAGRYSNENGNNGSKPHTPAPLEADCMEIFETGQVLLSTLGFPVFDAMRKPVPTNEPEELFYCTASGADGRGLYTPEGFLVLKGSMGRLDDSPTFASTWDEGLRKRLIDTGVMSPKGNRLVFPKDHLFGSPSMAARSLVGRRSNGWYLWKTKDGRTLHQVKRLTSANEAS